MAPRPTPAYEDDSTTNFRTESIGSLYPDGVRAMTLFHESTTKIQDRLKLLRALMSDQLTVCERCLDGMKSSVDRRTVKEAQDLASRWPEYTEETMKTIKAITKVCDAIMIEAVGAPKPPDPAPRIGYHDGPQGAPSEREQSWRRGYFSMGGLPSLNVKGYVPNWPW
jgi:hypothetical protein